MAKRKKFTPEQNQEMRGMYDLRDENGERKYSQRDLAKHFGTSQSYVCLINRDNPETEEKFKSQTEYQDYTIRQKINPETGKKFESQTEYQDYTARQIINPETGEKFRSYTECKDYNSRQRINPETGEKFRSRAEYESYNARKRTNPNAGDLEDRLGE